MLEKLPLASSFRDHPQRTFLIASACLILCLYWHTFTSPFVYDDLDQVVNNPNLSTWHDLAHRFLFHPVTLATSLLAYSGSIYRPIFWFSLFVDRTLWGLNPAGFHATSLLLHFLNGALAFNVLRRLSVAAPLAAASALLWLSLPTNTEAVAWVSARSYELCTLFVLSCLLAALGYLHSRNLLWAVICFLATGAAALSHELGIVTVPLLLLLALGMRKENLKILLVPIGAATLAMGAVEGLRVHVGVKTFSALASPKWTALALWKYVAFTFFPVHLSVERSSSISLGQPHPALLLAPILLAAALLYALRIRRSSLIPLGGLLWFLICIAPFVLLMNYQGVAERFAYLASLGLVVAVIGFCTGVSQPALRTSLTLGVLLWSAWSVVRTGLRVSDWADPVQLYQSSLAATPQSPSLHFNLGFSLRERGRLNEAAAEYRRVLQMNPRYPHACASLGDVYLAMNAYPAAQASYEKALAQDPKDTAVLLNSGSAYQSAGDLTNAEATYRRLLEIDPSSSPAHVNLGVLYMGEKRLQDAMHQFAMAIDLKTKDPVPYYDLGVIFQQAGRGDLAMVLYKKVLELKPGDEETLRNMQLIRPADPSAP